MAELTIIKKDSGAYIDSREVATLIGKPHNDLMKAIRKYCEYLNEGNFSLVDFFINSSYEDGKGETRPCYLLSKMGCEMVANKLTGEKGVQFTAAYVTKFNEMETAERTEQETICAMPAPRLGEYNACARIVVRALRNIDATPEQIVMFLKGVYEPLGIIVSAEFDTGSDAEPQMYTARQIAEMLGVYSLTGNPHAHAVSCILNENLFISDSHKNVVTMDYGDHIGISVRYDEYAAHSVKNWLVECGLPSEVYGFERTYKIRYVQ